MPSKISVKHAMEAIGLATGLYGKDDVASINAFMRGVDDGYNQVEANLFGYGDPVIRPGSPYEYGLSFGQVACMIDYRGLRTEGVMETVNDSLRSRTWFRSEDFLDDPFLQTR